jgi:hypothetical protein
VVGRHNRLCPGTDSGGFGWPEMAAQYGLGEAVHQQGVTVDAG